MGAAFAFAPYALAESPSGHQVAFVDVAQSSGIIFQHDNAASPEKYLIETMGSGCGWIDYDQDGLLDLYLVNGAATEIYNPKHPLRSALYRNNGDGTFTDVTVKAGVGAEGLFGMGVAVGDYDGDGWVDIYITSYGRNILYHNNGNGTFTDVTNEAGVAAPGWSTCAVWFDYDNDGKLDLFVSSFVVYEKSLNILCTDEGLSRRYYCVPRLFKPRASHLFHNDGNGKFTDVSGSLGPGMTRPKASRGAAVADLFNGGGIDIVLNNMDSAPTLLRNRGANRAGHWISVKLQGDPARKTPRDAIGSVMREIRVDLPADLRAALRAMFAAITEHPDEQLVLYELTTYALRDPETVELARWQYESYLGQATDYLDYVADRARIRWTLPIPVLARLVVTTIDGLALNWLPDRDTEIACQVLDAFAAHLASLAEPST